MYLTVALAASNLTGSKMSDFFSHTKANYQIRGIVFIRGTWHWKRKQENK
jgi:hypothetical protein